VTLSGINEFVNDKKLRADIEQTLANMKDASGNAKELTENADRAIADLQKQLGELTTKYGQVATDLSDTIAQAQKLLAKADSGDGTIAKLLNDPSLYENLNDAVQRAEQAMAEAKQLIEKLQAEGLPLKFGE